MTLLQHLARWHGGDSGNTRNALMGVGHLNYTGFIFPKTIRL